MCFLSYIVTVKMKDIWVSRHLAISMYVLFFFSLSFARNNNVWHAYNDSGAEMMVRVKFKWIKTSFCSFFQKNFSK